MICILLFITLFGCPEAPSVESESTLEVLEGTWAGELYCYQEGTSSSGQASLVLEKNNDTVSGTINFSGTDPSEFITTAALELWLDENGELDGAWSDCEIEAELSYLECHFWSQPQDADFKPNAWALNEEKTIFSILENSHVESEAQKCQGDLVKTQ
jgi:hypothetical protein